MRCFLEVKNEEKAYMLYLYDVSALLVTKNYLTIYAGGVRNAFTVIFSTDDEAISAREKIHEAIVAGMEKDSKVAEVKITANDWRIVEN